MSFPTPFSFNLQPDFEIQRDDQSDTSSVFSLSQDQDQDQDEESVAECQECNTHEVIGKPLTEAELGECPICYDQLSMINLTITRCGHAMHSSCMFMALEKADCCPMCRTQIMRSIPEDDDDESEGEYEDRDDDQEEDQEANEEEQNNTPSLEQFATKLQNMGYTMADVLGIFYDAKPEVSNKRYTPEFWQKIDADIEGILDGTIPLSARDTRSYADVVKTQVQDKHEQ
jgi:Ring finger domain